mmetsp:Transcript_574/g.888  ORF Transcript_574/g.888 Transcript_574/m.888 type:complete len:450 (+) Transcript_574:153-1502(+)
MRDSAWTRPFDLTYHKTSVWKSPFGEIAVQLNSTNLLPQLTLSPEAVADIWRQQSHSAKGWFICAPQPGTKFRINKVSWREAKSEHLLKVGLRYDSSSKSHIYEKMFGEIAETLEEDAEVSALDLVKLQAWYRFESKVLHISFSALYPDIVVQIRPIEPLKIVATPLSQELYRNTNEDFRSGVLTMDTAHRLVPLLSSDTMLDNYPCVGIWISGLGNTEDSLTHPFVWAALVRFTQLKQIKARLSADADQYRFLLLSFSKSIKFYETQVVGLAGQSCWRVITRSVVVPISQRSLPYSVVFTPDLPSFGNLTPESSIAHNLNSPDASDFSALQLCDLVECPPAAESNLVDTLEKQASEIKVLQEQIKKLNELVMTLTPCRTCRCNSVTNTPDVRKKTPPIYSPVAKPRQRQKSISRTGSTYEDEFALLKSLRMSKGPLEMVSPPSKEVRH